MEIQYRGKRYDFVCSKNEVKLVDKSDQEIKVDINFIKEQEAQRKAEEALKQFWSNIIPE
ncbi:hypothetical protein DMO16_23755 [Fictibacillus sp. S7]|nr:hypothetical protein DMO16_23755 [Fictibacillus sp. S7]